MIAYFRGLVPPLSQSGHCDQSEQSEQSEKKERVIEIVTHPFTKKSRMGRPPSVHLLSQKLMNFAARDFDGTAKPTAQITLSSLTPNGYS